jgi:hypothetical protein
MCHANTLCLLLLALGAVWLIAVALDPERSGLAASSSPSLPAQRDRAMEELRFQAAGGGANSSMPAESVTAAVTAPVRHRSRSERP